MQPIARAGTPLCQVQRQPLLRGVLTDEGTRVAWVPEHPRPAKLLWRTAPSRRPGFS
jgi:hypothetical protein